MVLCQRRAALSSPLFDASGVILKITSANHSGPRSPDPNTALVQSPEVPVHAGRSWLYQIFRDLFSWLNYSTHVGKLDCIDIHFKGNLRDGSML